METYIVVSATEDGAYLEQIGKDALMSRLNTDYYGREPKFLTPGHHGIDLMETTGLFIIKGTVVEPKAKVVTTQWDV